MKNYLSEKSRLGTDCIWYRFYVCLLSPILNLQIHTYFPTQTFTKMEIYTNKFFHPLFLQWNEFPYEGKLSKKKYVLHIYLFLV